nr:DUF1152 domain-containing protein [Paraconexibacter antarcticus]
MGGGGDVVGALAFAVWAHAACGLETVVGGLTWERRPVDPLPGPRRLGEVVGAEPLNLAVAVAGPDTTGPGGFAFAEARMAGFLGRPTVLVDPNAGPAAVGRALADAARQRGADLVVLLDVGGDVLAHGGEAGLASPLADAVLLAAGPACAAAGVPVLGALFGAGCDGELKPAEVAERLAELEATSAPVDRIKLPAELLPRLAAAAVTVPTEASAMAIACARGDRGERPIRGGRRLVELTELGGRLCLFDVGAALAGPARLAAALDPDGTLADADRLLEARGIRTELAYERDAAAAGTVPDPLP